MQSSVIVVLAIYIISLAFSKQQGSIYDFLGSSRRQNLLGKKMLHSLARILHKGVSRKLEVDKNMSNGEISRWENVKNSLEAIRDRYAAVKADRVWRNKPKSQMVTEVFNHPLWILKSLVGQKAKTNYSRSILIREG